MVRTARHSLSIDAVALGTRCETTLEHGGFQHLLGISPGLNPLQTLCGAQDRRGTTLIHNSERCQSRHTPAPHHRSKSTSYNLMSLQTGPSLLCSGTSSPTDIFATHLLLHHPRGKDLLNDIGIILGRLLGTGKVNSLFLAHHVPLALSQHRMAACFPPNPPAGKTEPALGAGRAVLGEPLLGPRV